MPSTAAANPSGAFLRLFGRPELQWDGRSFPLPFERRNQLIAYLAMRRSWVGRTELAELLWPDQTSKLSHANLRKTVFRLQSLPWGGTLEAQGSALRFAVRTDADDVGSAETPSAPFADLLAGYEDGGEAWSQWLGFERERTRVAWRAAALKRLQSGSLDENEAIELSGWLLASDPADEAALLTHMNCLARGGQPGRAREAYRMFQARLANDFGLEPSAAAKSALDAIEQPGAPLVGNKLPTLREEGTAQTGEDDPGFVGRIVELRQVMGWLSGAERRIVCIVGQGGAGKTRLARRAMRQMASHYGDGVRFVPLEDVPSEGDVIARLARVLGVTLSGSSPALAQVVKVLHDKHMLLVFDNFEHVQGGAAALTELLRECPRVSALVTSRVRPALADQQSLQLDGLPCPDAVDEDRIETFDAVRLFMNAARRADPAFNAAIGARSIIDICRQVEGLPLALEIAAGWTRVLSCAAIAGELRHSSELLETVDAARPARHASMEVVFGQSWALLTNAEREAFARLSVFRGGFTAAAARIVARAPLPVLGALADKSLLRKDEARLQIHPLLQQLAASRLAKEGSLEEAEEAHATHFHQLMAQLRRASVAGDRAVLDELDVELENCRKAWRWAVAHGRADLLLRSAATMRNFFDHRGRFEEGLLLMREALDADNPALDRARPLVMSVAAHLEYRLDRYLPAMETARAAQRLAGEDDIESRLQCCKTLAVCSFRLGQYDQARHYFKDALALAPESDDPRNAAAMLDNLSLVEKAEGRMDEALK
ncbi:MAG TPA: AAA family ATPase, partial [Ramlibacter sp.]|nr:AAA family ATPase [Ramlibacter sp.]